MKTQNTCNVFGNIGVFNTLSIMMSSGQLSQVGIFDADRDGNISFSIEPGEYYISLGNVKKTVTLEPGKVNIKDMLNV